MEDDDDWELLHHDSTPIAHNNINLLHGIIHVDGEGEFSNDIIRSDYFSIDQINNNTYHGGYVTAEGSVDSDNPSWIDPHSLIPYPIKDSAQFCSDSTTHRSESDDGKFGEFAHLPTQENVEIVHATSGETQKSDSENSSDESSEEKESGDVKNVAIEAAESARIEEENKTPMWWKLPLELLKYCVFRASPVWSISVAAVVMGFVILGRRLYKMKKKTRSLPLKLTLDDKKVSQFMTRAARLNEAFSVVKRVPVIRPSLPAAGVTQWPMMSLR